jgi:hypothetical protein
VADVRADGHRPGGARRDELGIHEPSVRPIRVGEDPAEAVAPADIEDERDGRTPGNALLEPPVGFGPEALAPRPALARLRRVDPGQPDEPGAAGKPVDEQGVAVDDTLDRHLQALVRGREGAARVDGQRQQQDEEGAATQRPPRH